MTLQLAVGAAVAADHPDPARNHLAAAAAPAARGGAGDLDRPGPRRAARPYAVDPADPDPAADARLRHAGRRGGAAAGDRAGGRPTPRRSCWRWTCRDPCAPPTSNPTGSPSPRRRRSPSSSPRTAGPRSASSPSPASPGLQVPPTTDTDKLIEAINNLSPRHAVRRSARPSSPRSTASPRSTRPWPPPGSMRNRPSGRATRRT